MSYDHLLVSGQDGILEVTVNRPQVLNALNRETLHELAQVFTQDAMADDVRVVIIRGSGERAFIAGADIQEMQKMNPYELYQFMRLGHDVLGSVARLPKPVIAAIGGYCLGGGLELALCCDIRVGCPEARFALPEIKLGIIPGWGGTKRLAQAVGPSRARELTMTGRTIDGQEAERIGLVQRLASSRDGLDELARSIAKEIAAYSPITLRLLKGALDEAPRLTSEGLAEMEARTNAVLASTEDGQEGFTAFLEKRKPNFQGR